MRPGCAGGVLHYVMSGRRSHAEDVGVDTLPQAEHTAGLHQRGHGQASLLLARRTVGVRVSLTHLQLPHAGLQECLPQLDVSPRRDPDTGECPHVFGPPGDQDLPVAALQDDHHAHIDPPLDCGGGQQGLVGGAEAVHRAEGRVGQQGRGG